MKPILITSQCFHWHNWKQLPKFKAQRIILSVVYNDLSCLVSPGSTCDLNYLNQMAAFSLLLFINLIINCRKGNSHKKSKKKVNIFFKKESFYSCKQTARPSIYKVYLSIVMIYVLFTFQVSQRAGHFESHLHLKWLYKLSTFCIHTMCCDVHVSFFLRCVMKSLL